jgi:hypothetical protein
MDVGLTRSAVPEGRPAFTRVRLSGLSKTPDEIEAEITERVEQAHHRQEQLAQGRILDGDRILYGIRVVTKDNQPYTDISSGRLYELLSHMEPGDSVVVETPGQWTEDHSIQASRTGDGAWQVEYRNGDGDYRAECDDAATLHEILVGWADGSPDWRDHAD